ncbi:MAG: hypothetical protein ACREMG_05380 [Gemmatimonadales bacterium]
MARLFVVRAFVRWSRLRMGLRWASSQRSGAWRRWRLALAMLAHQGRWIAQSALLGVRDPDVLRRHLVVEGEANLPPVGTATLLLGFHLGSPRGDLALRLVGRRVTWVGQPRISKGWSRIMRFPLLDLRQGLGKPRARAGWLYHARRVLLDGGAVFIAADRLAGRPGPEIVVPGGPIPIASGWLALRRHTGAVTLPVLSHMEGRRWVVTIHRPLPPLESDPRTDFERCRDALTPLLADYLGRFPEQSVYLMFNPRMSNVP